MKKSLNLPHESIIVITQSLKEASRKQYTPYLREYIQREGINQMAPEKLIRYLTVLFNRGLGYSAINTARSAVSTLSSMLGKEQIGNDIVVTRFMRGVFNSRPALPRYSFTWDPDLVLQKLDTCDKDKTFIDFSRKVVFLTTLLSGQRVSTISKLKLADITFRDTDLYINVSSMIKQTKPGIHQKPLHFTKFDRKPNLCVYGLLKEYVRRSQPYRISLTDNNNNIFIATTKPYHNVTTNTLSNWIRHVLQSCGIQEFGPHSLRGAATSALNRHSIPTDSILEAAGWSNESTFRKFYKRPIRHQAEIDITLLNNLP